MANCEVIEGKVWLKGDWHMHSRHSTDSSNNSIATILRFAEQHGYDYLAITDHDVHMDGAVASNVWADPEFQSNTLALFYGAELTAARGHINILSADPYDHQRVFDNRDARDWDLNALKHELGVHFSANHPICKNHYGYSFDLADSIEVWNTSNWSKNVAAQRVWDDMLLSGRMLPARGGSDAHHGLPERPDMDNPRSVEAMANYIGTPTTWVLAEDKRAASILAALEEGRATVSANPNTPRAELWADEGRGFDIFMGSNNQVADQEVRFEIRLVGERILGARYRVNVIRNRAEPMVLWTDPETGIASFAEKVSKRSYYRAEVEGPQTPFPSVPLCNAQSGTMIAITNPIYFGYDPNF